MSPTRPADDPHVVLHTAPDQLTVEVTGELDLRTAREMKAVLSRAVGGGRRAVHLDLSRVSYVDRPGTRALAEAAAAADLVGGKVAVVRASDAVKRALREAGLGRLVLTDPPPDVEIDLTDP